MWREIEGFKECEKIEFDFSTGKTYEESINKLHKIIAAYGTTRAILDFLRMVANEDCAFYRYKYIFPEQSPTKEEMRALHVLWRWGGEKLGRMKPRSCIGWHTSFSLNGVTC